jgi:hypothetical protein
MSRSMKRIVLLVNCPTTAKPHSPQRPDLFLASFSCDVVMEWLIPPRHRTTAVVGEGKQRLQ